MTYHEQYGFNKPAAEELRFEEPGFNVVKLNNNIYSNVSNNHRTRDDWLKIIPSAAFFLGHDQILGKIVIMVYEDPSSGKISTVLFSCLGDMCFNSLTLDNKSRFFAACENLREPLRKSNVRRALAITLLKTYSSLNDEIITSLSTGLKVKEWDETVAGELASTMELAKGKTPEQIGRKLLDVGLLQPHFIESTVLDVIYEDNPNIIESNNELVYLLGEQIEQLFDPLTEYSPEGNIKAYEPPQVTKDEENDDGLSKSICAELLQFQENTTQVLINFLQNFVIPLRVKVLNGEFKDLSIAKFNQILPPTIDEITRMNCLLLEALQKAVPFGSFEVVKACGMTIPHFYKAYMRHESAFKCYSHLLKAFCRDHELEFQPDFSERRIESIMNSSLNLTKFKLILERLINIKNWASEDESIQVREHYKNSVETIDSFARDELKPYSKRVFTPSGKVLTEICDGVPSSLTYGWLNRKVVSVYDAKDLIDEKDDVIVLFNDYVIFARVDHDTIDKQNENPIKPKISDIIMNSLINEKPMKNMPNLVIRKWALISDFEIETFGVNSLKLVFKKHEKETLIYEVENSTKFLNLLNKAKILNKSTPFHLFKNLGFGFTIFSAAHERKLYGKEVSRSPIALFLNVKLNEKLLQEFDLFAGISATFADDDVIKIQNLTISGEKATYTISTTEFSSFIPEIVSALELQRHNYKNKRMLNLMVNSNTYLLDSVTSVPAYTDRNNRRSLSLSSQTVTRMPSTRLSRSSTRRSSIDVNYAKPLPEIVDDSRPKPISKSAQSKSKQPKTIEVKKSNSNLKKSKLKNRISQLFSSKKQKTEIFSKQESKVKSAASNPAPISKPPISQPLRTKRSGISYFSDSESDSEGSANTSQEDCTTFESTMTPVFDDTDDDIGSLGESNNIQSLSQPYKSENWLLSRDNSSKNFNLRVTSIGSQKKNNQNLLESEVIKEAVDPIAAPTPTTTQKCHNNESLPPQFNPNMNIGSRQIQAPAKEIHSAQTAQSNQVELTTPVPNAKIPTFNSLDDDFNVPILRVGYDSTEDFNADDNEDDVFYTPKSLGVDFPNFESRESFQAPTDAVKSGEYIEPEGVDLSNTFERFTMESLARDFSFNTNYDQNRNAQQEPQSPSLTSQLDTESTENIEFSNLDWASPSQLNSRLYEDANGLNIVIDESFGYLAGVLDNSCVISDELKNSETYKTLPRSFSSIKYLAAYIDNDTPISKELYDFLEE